MVCCLKNPNEFKTNSRSAKKSNVDCRQKDEQTAQAGEIAVLDVEISLSRSGVGYEESVSLNREYIVPGASWAGDYRGGGDTASTRTTVHFTSFPAVVFNLPLSPSSSYFTSLPTTKSVAFTEAFGLVRQV